MVHLISSITDGADFSWEKPSQYEDISCLLIFKSLDCFALDEKENDWNKQLNQVYKAHYY